MGYISKWFCIPNWRQVYMEDYIYNIYMSYKRLLRFNKLKLLLLRIGRTDPIPYIVFLCETIFSNFKQNKQFFKGKKNSENFPRILLKFFKFSNFHSIFKRNFWFCKIHLWNKTYLHSNWEKKNYKNLSFVWRERRKKNLENLENFGKF